MCPAFDRHHSGILPGFVRHSSGVRPPFLWHPSGVRPAVARHSSVLSSIVPCNSGAVLCSIPVSILSPCLDKRARLHIARAAKAFAPPRLKNQSHNTCKTPARVAMVSPPAKLHRMRRTSVPPFWIRLVSAAASASVNANGGVHCGEGGAAAALLQREAAAASEARAERRAPAGWIGSDLGGIASSIESEIDSRNGEHLPAESDQM